MNDAALLKILDLKTSYAAKDIMPSYSFNRLKFQVCM
jgi:hypothetical protein